MNIGIVTTWFERGGAYVSRQYRDALAGEHEVFIYARGGERFAVDDPEWDSSRVTWGHSLPAHGRTAFRLPHFKRWILERKLDAVLFNEQLWWAPVVLCRDLGVASIGYVDYYTEQTVPLFANYDLLLCNTRRHRSVFDWHPDCSYIPWGTDVDRFRPVSSETAQPGRLTFFHSAGFSPRRKGTDFVLQALAKLPDAARLVVHAQVPLEASLPELSPLIGSLRDAQRLEVVDRTVGAPGLYHRGDVYVYPTRLEGIGLTIAEALACGLPVVLPDGAPMNEFVNDSVARLVRIDRYLPRSDGYYWPQGLVDVADLTRQMGWFVENPSQLESLKLAARRHAETALNWNDRRAQLCERISGISPRTDAATRQARQAAMAFERSRSDLRLFFPTLNRVLLKAADLLQPLTSRYSGR